MEQLELDFGDAVALTWQDSQAREGWSYDQGERKTAEVESLGRVVYSSDDVLTISSSIRTGKHPATMADLSIPWDSVREIQVLEEYSI